MSQVISVTSARILCGKSMWKIPDATEDGGGAAVVQLPPVHLRECVIDSITGIAIKTGPRCTGQN